MQGCSKETLTEVAPKERASENTQPMQAAAAAQPTAMQAAWLRFVDRVERGEQTDPTGQYVAKGTMVAAGPAGQRVARPKFDAATAEFAKHYMLRSGEIIGIGPDSNNLYQECNDCIPVECDGSVRCVGGPVTPTFVSSLGKGGTGAIHDLKIIYNNPSQSATKIRDGAGYIMLNADLNKGAGGASIYFAFTRNAQQVLSGPEYDQGRPYSSPSDILRGFETQNGGHFSIPSPSLSFFHIWTYDAGYTQADLNGGAGGEYIFSYQTKNPSYSNNAEVTEVGVLSGNSDTIQPPAGWIKWNKDLNEGAGGDYIYFCYKY